MTPGAVPDYVLWEITLACNLRCTHCMTGSGRRAPGELSTDEALHLCDDLADLGVGAVALMGGEPLVRPDWEDIAGRLSDREIPVGLATNGVLLDDATLARALDLGVNQVVIGLDGGPAVHDAIRGPGTFERAVSALARAGGMGVPHRMALTSLHQGNRDQLPAILEVLLREAPGITWAVNMTSIREGMRMDMSMRADEALFLRTVEFIDGARRKHGDRLEIMGSHDIGYCSARYPDIQAGPWEGCPAGLSALGITATGGVKGCLALPDGFVEGNVRHESLADIWNDPGRFPYNRRFTPDDLAGACRGCDRGASCRGGCTEWAVTMTGRPHHAPFCLHRMERRGRP